MTQANALDVEQVVVTARRREERLHDVPISATVYNQQQLTNRNVFQAADLATYTPSLSVNSQFGPEYSTFSIRGFTQELRTASSVGVYFADAVAPRGGDEGLQGGDGAGPGAFFDLQNVQVLKGPQGTLFGRNTTGGDVLIVPAKPTDQFGGYLQGSYGNYNMVGLQGVLNVPVDDDVRLRVGFDRMTRDGYENNISGIGPSHFADVNYIAGRVSLDADVTPDIENYTVANFSNSDTNSTYQQQFVCNPLSTFSFLTCPQIARAGGTTFIPQKNFYDVQNDLPNPESFLRQWQVVNTTTWHASDLLTVKNIAAYGDVQSVLRQEALGNNWIIPQTVFGFPTGPLAGTPIYFLGVNPSGLITDQSTFSEELQVQGHSGDNRLIWQSGLYMEQSEPHSIPFNHSPSLIACPDLNPNALKCFDALAELFGLPPGSIGNTGINASTLAYRNYAVYLQGTYSITDQLKFTAGARYTQDITTGNGYLETFHYTNPFPSAATSASCIITFASIANGCRVHDRQYSSAPTYTFDLDYAPSEDLMTYIKYSRGYRQGSVNPQGPQGFQIFAPETVDAYEAGVKNDFDGAVRGTADLAIFYNDLSNQQLQEGFISSKNLAPATTGIVNAGQSQMWGFEIESSIIPVDWFRLDLSYAYLNTRLEKETPVVFPPGSVYDIANATTEVGGPLPYTPQNKISLTGTFTLPVPESYGQVLFAATYSYADPYVTNSPASTPFGVQDQTNIVNLNINWNAIEGSPVDVALFATNLLQDKYAIQTPGLYNALGVESRSLGQPRFFGGRVTVHFGD